MPDKGKSKSGLHCGMRIAGGLLVLSAVAKIELLTGIRSYPQGWARVLAAGWFGSAAAGAWGLFRLKSWGFYFLYAYIATATALFSISVVPFLFRLLPLRGGAATALLLLTNLGALAFAVALHAAGAGARRTRSRRP